MFFSAKIALAQIWLHMKSGLKSLKLEQNLELNQEVVLMDRSGVAHLVGVGDANTKSFLFSHLM